jgi:alkylhydroperoxidase family enzyme
VSELWRQEKVFSELEQVVLAYAEAIVRTDLDVDDELFARIRNHMAEPELVELTCWICLEDFYSKFNRSFRVDAQGFCLVRE